MALCLTGQNVEKAPSKPLKLAIAGALMAAVVAAQEWEVSIARTVAGQTLCIHALGDPVQSRIAQVEIQSCDVVSVDQVISRVLASLVALYAARPKGIAAKIDFLQWNATGVVVASEARIVLTGHSRLTDVFRGLRLVVRKLARDGSGMAVIGHGDHE